MTTTTESFAPEFAVHKTCMNARYDEPISFADATYKTMPVRVVRARHDRGNGMSAVKKSLILGTVACAIALAGCGGGDDGAGGTGAVSPQGGAGGTNPQGG